MGGVKREIDQRKRYVKLSVFEGKHIGNVTLWYFDNFEHV